MKKRSFGAPWLNDARLPDKDDAGDRVYGSKRPKQRAPHRAMSLAVCSVPATRARAPFKLEITSDRKKRRFWFTALVGHKATADDPLAFLPSHKPDARGYVYDFMSDYASTTSQKIGQGWIDAVNACAKKRK